MVVFIERTIASLFVFISMIPYISDCSTWILQVMIRTICESLSVLIVDCVLRGKIAPERGGIERGK